MKRLLLVLSILLGMVSAQAAPVSLEAARTLGQCFVKANFDYASQSDDLVLVYSQPSFYVFNVGETGFVILSADDSYRPVIGYSDEGVFSTDNPAMMHYLNGISESRTRRTATGSTKEIRDEWQRLGDEGKLLARFKGKEASYLVETKWNQNYPYNYCCPVAEDGPGGHVYAGCVATAGAQLMRYWNFPAQGTGSHTYTPEDNPQYGPITVNFGEATYDWDNMPLTINSSSPIAQIEAIGQLIYHVGVSVDMNYRPTSSGAVTGRLCEVMPQHFYYTNQMLNLYRETYTREEYLDLIYRSVDMSWPMVHRGGGHAYVLDGYNEAGMVHFNWGWSGSDDGWFDIDNHDYVDGESVIYNYVPAEIYAATPNAPMDLTVTPEPDHQLAATVSWSNPTLTLTNQTLTSIDQIVVMRDNEIVFTEENVTPGASMSFVDTDLPRFDVYQYTVYAVCNGQRGRSLVLDGASVGPTCEWKFVVSSNNFQGWQDSYIAVYNLAGHEVDQVTVNNSTPTVVTVDMPLGMFKLAWVPSENATTSMNITMNIKDADGSSVYNYSGTLGDFPAGVFYEGNNGCGMSPDCGVPSNLMVTKEEDNEHTLILQWDGVEDPGYGYLIYRDDEVMRLITDGSTTFRDEDVPVGGHCYQVAILCEGGLSETSNMYCESSGACYPPRHLNFETTSSFKCKLLWEAPMPNEGVSGYELYRKSDTEDYKRIKLLNANATSYTDNSVNTEGDYYYQLIAHYEDLDCDSYPAAYLYDPNQYYLHFYYSPTGISEADNGVRLYPNPTNGVLKIEAPAMQRITVCNLLGQQVYEAQVNADEASVDLKGLGKGMYLVTVQTVNGIASKKISIVE